MTFNKLKFLLITLFFIIISGGGIKSTDPIENVNYKIQHCQRSGNYLDSDGSNVYVKSGNEDNPFQMWQFKSLGNGIYKIQHCQRSGNYLDSDGSNVYVKSGNEDNPFQMWQFKSLGNGIYKIQHCQRSGNYLDSDGSNVYVKSGNEDNPFQMWKLIPSGYALQAIIENFDYGDYKSVLNILSDHKKLAISSVDIVTILDRDLGAKISGGYIQNKTESFSWGLNQKIGFSAKTTVKSGVPYLAEGKIELGFSAEFSSNQQYSTTNTKAFDVRYEMSPKEPGTYRVGRIVYFAEDVELPFRARARLKATSLTRNNLPSSAVESLFTYEGLNNEIVERGNDYIIVNINGNLKANYGVWTETIFSRLEHLYTE